MIDRVNHPTFQTHTCRICHIKYILSSMWYIKKNSTHYKFKKITHKLHIKLMRFFILVVSVKTSLFSPKLWENNLLVTPFLWNKPNIWSHTLFISMRQYKGWISEHNYKIIIKSSTLPINTHTQRERESQSDQRKKNSPSPYIH